MVKYSILNYGRMIADRVRVDSYATALRTAIGRETVVADIGSGTGMLSLLACSFGARRVYAIEPGDCIDLARALVSCPSRT